MLLTGRTLSAAEAADLGLVTWLVAAPQLAAKLDEVTGELLGRSAAVLRLTKRAVAPPVEEFERALAEAERLYLEELTRTEDMNEGIAAFLEKRPPRWKHQ